MVTSEFPLMGVNQRPVSQHLYVPSVGGSVFLGKHTLLAMVAANVLFLLPSWVTDVREPSAMSAFHKEDVTVTQRPQALLGVREIQEHSCAYMPIAILTRWFWNQKLFPSVDHCLSFLNIKFLNALSTFRTAGSVPVGSRYRQTQSWPFLCSGHSWKKHIQLSHPETESQRTLSKNPSVNAHIQSDTR